MNCSRKYSPLTRELLDWREENVGKISAAKVGPSKDGVWGRNDRVFKDGAVVEFG